MSKNYPARPSRPSVIRGVRGQALRLGALALACFTLAACQTSQSRQQQLAQICADPASLRPDSFYFNECMAITPMTDKQRVNLYQRIAPTVPN